MSWFKLDDQFSTHPKVLRAGPEAAWLFVCGGCYCAKHLTDGLIPKAAVSTLATLRGCARLVETLVRENLWHDRGENYEVHDYLEYNPSREQVLTERRKASERRAKGGRRSRDGTATNICPDPTRPEVLTEPLAPAKPPRARDLLFEALCQETGTAWGELTDRSRGPFNAVVRDLKALGVTPDELHHRAGAYRRKFPNAVLTASALGKHWASLGNGRAATPPLETDELTADERAALAAEWSNP